MRAHLLAAVLIAPLAGCVDAPLTPAHLDPDGQLHGVRMAQGAFSAEPTEASQAAVQITAVLATQPDGLLADAAAFTPSAEAVYLHLRADRLASPRPVTFVWTHGDQREEVPGLLAPSTTLTMAASHHLDEQSIGTWKVEILGEATEGDAPRTLFEREFYVLSE